LWNSSTSQNTDISMDVEAVYSPSALNAKRSQIFGY
jgi:hypothetical protein